MKAVFRALVSDVGRLLLCGLVMSLSYLPPLRYRWYFDIILRALALLIIGAPIFRDAIRGLLRRDLLDEKFLMSVASIGAFALGEPLEAVAVLAFFTIGEMFEHYAVRRSRDSIRALMKIRPDTATVLRGGEECEMDAEDIALGDILICRTGDRIATDGVIVGGDADLDCSMLSGESIPVPVTEGDEVQSGAVLLGGFLKIRVIRIAEQSCASRILNLVETASERKSKEEAFITRFSRVYTPVVVGLAVLLCVIPSVFGILSFGEAFRRALTFLVISCPCALVISVPMAFFGGIGASASQGILFKGGNVFSPLARANTFVFDKTGTLTSGTFEISEVTSPTMRRDEFLSLLASAEYPSTHPLALAIKGAVKTIRVPEEATERAGYGVIAKIDGSILAVGNRRMLDEYATERELPLPTDERGVIYAIRDGVLIGYLRVSDNIRDGAKCAFASLRSLGATRLAILSGDRQESVATVAGALGADTYEGGLLPEDKFARLEALICEGDGVVYVGDGINDTPSLARADVGVAMGGIGQDSALEVSDLSILTDDLEKLPVAVKIARKTLAIAKENILFAIGIKLLVLVLGALGIASMWLAVFADVGVCVIAILNAMRALYVNKN